jgi:MFS family permease
MIILTLPGGVAADRMQKKIVIQIGQASSAVISLINTIALVIGYVSPEHPESWWVLMVCGVLQGGIMGFIMPARNAIINEIVGREHLMNAISLNNLGVNVFRLLAPALAGFLVDAFDFWVVFAINTVLYVIATLCVVFVPASPVAATGGGNTLNDVVEGWKYIRREKTIFLILAFVMSMTILGMPYMHLLPMFTEGILDVGGTGMGVLVSASGIGAILVALIIASMRSRNRGLLMLYSGLIVSVALVIFAFTRSWYLWLVLMAFIGIGNTGVIALGNSLVQHYVDAQYRGRVMSFFALSFGFGSLGAFFAGIMAQHIGAPWAVGSLAAILVVVAVVVLASSKNLRNLN